MELKAHTIKNISFITHDTFILHIDISESGFQFKSGDYCFIQNKFSATPEEKRPFSIASSPTDTSQIEFCIKIYGDWTRQLSTLRPGQLVYVSDPQDDSHLVDEDYLVFLVGGVGIAPVMSMIRYLVDTHSTKQIILIYGNKTERDIIYRSELNKIISQYSYIQVVHVLSEEPADSVWKGERGFLTEELLLREVDLSKHPYFYSYGNPMFLQIAHTLVSKFRK